MLLHRSQLQIIHTVMKCAVLNWQIHKSAAAAAAGQKAQCKNSLHFRKVTNTQSEGGIYQCYLNTYNPTDYVHVTCSISDKKGCRLLLNCFLWPSLEELHAFSMNKVDKTKGDREFLQYSNYYEWQIVLIQNFVRLYVCTHPHSKTLFKSNAWDMDRMWQIQSE